MDALFEKQLTKKGNIMDRGKIISIIILGILALFVAQNGDAKQQLQISADQLHIKDLSYNQEGQLKVSGPNGISQTYKVSKGQSLIPVYELRLKEDGLYEYELTLVTQEGEEAVTDPRNGRVNAKRTLGSAEKLYGAFTVVNGRIVEGQLESDQNNDVQR